LPRILLIEDEPALRRALLRGLGEERYTVDVAGDGETGLWAAQGGEHELILLDLLLPKLSGLEVCRRLRAAGLRTPILMLTARDSTQDVVAGLDAGANDYLVKPFAFQELLARMRALLRVGTAAGTAQLQHADLRLDLAGLRAFRGEQELTLTNKEFQLLEILMRRAGHVLSRQSLRDTLWAHDSDPESNALEVHIARLRRKIDCDRDAPLLRTVRGVGYVLRQGAP
jgi:two-component system OmpR family response regulator